jgi:multidrug efflux system membrane fusion protein
MKRLWPVLAGVLIAAVAGFWAYPRLTVAPVASAAVPDTGTGQRGGGQHHGAAGGGGTPATTVVTAVVTTKDVPITKDAVGWVEPIATVAVKPRIDGIIVAQAVKDGQVVKAGDLLYRLDDAVIQATIAKDTATMAKDQANLDQANADLKRDKSLVGRNDVVTEQQFEQQTALAKADEASIAFDKAQLQSDQVQLGYTVISAPIAGRVGVVGATTGNLVRASDTATLLTITQMAPLRISFSVPERDLDDYRVALAGPDPVPVEARDPGSATPRASGRLTFIDSSINPASGTIIVKAEFANADSLLWPGQYTRVQTRIGIRKGVTVVPTVAIQQNSQGPFVFLSTPGGTARIQPVTVADALSDSAVISSGLKPGDHVVVEGQLRLSDGAPIKEAGADSGKKAAAASAGKGGAAL